MSTEQYKAMLQALVDGVLAPVITTAIKQRLPLDSVAGVLLGAAVGVAKRAGMTREKFLKALETEWPSDPPPS